MTKRCRGCVKMRKIVARGLCKHCYDAARRRQVAQHFPLQRHAVTHRELAERLGIGLSTVGIALRTGRLKVDAAGAVVQWDGLRRTNDAPPKVSCQICGKPLTNSRKRRCMTCVTAALFR